MTVAQLIAELKKCPQDAPIMVLCDGPPVEAESVSVSTFEGVIEAHIC